MNTMANMRVTKLGGWLGLAAMLLMELAGCGGGGGSSPPANPGLTVAGAGQKGPFLAGGTVTAYKLDAAAARTATTLATTTDASGHYSLAGVPWTGLTEIAVAGRFYNEATDADSAGSLALSALLDLQAGAMVRANLYTHLLAGRIRTLMAAGAAYAAARTQALAELANRFNLSGSIGPETLDLTDGASANAADNANLLLLSAAVLGGGADTQAAIDALRDDFADNGRMDSVAFNAIRRAARAQSLATLRTRLMSKYAALANPPGPANLTHPPVWTAGGGLPDTGVTASQCYQAGSNALVACSSAEAQALSPSQDGMLGLDTDPATNGDADGKLGFSYTKLGADGQPLSNQTGAYSETGSEAAGTHWSCVRDNLTGLIWEVKTADGGLRDLNKIYTNYDDPNQAQKSIGSNPTQAEIDAATNTRGFVAAVNVAGLCGANDWRLPTVDELQGLVDYGVAFPGPTIDANFFPNTKELSFFWTSSPIVGGWPFKAWLVCFCNGSVSSAYGRSDNRLVRLVRASQ